MAEPYSIMFRKDVNYFNVDTDREKLITLFAESLGLTLDPADYPALIITGEIENSDGVAAFSAAKLDPGIKMDIISKDFNYEMPASDRMRGDETACVIPLTVIASATADPGVIVRRDDNGDFKANAATLNTIILEKNTPTSPNPNIYIYGNPIFDNNGNLIVNIEGVASEAQDLIGSIAGMDIADIFATSSGVYLPVVKSAENVTTYISGIRIKSPVNTDVTKGIFQIGSNIDGSDTYAKRAITATTATNLSINGSNIPSTSFARLDVANTFSTSVKNTFGDIDVKYTGYITKLTTDMIVFNNNIPSARPSQPTFYNAPADNTSYAPNGTVLLAWNGHLTATKMYNAVYNDLAECFIPQIGSQYNDLKNKIVEVNDLGHVRLATKLSNRVIGIVSDNYGYLLGGLEDEVINNKKIPVGLSGTLWVDAYNTNTAEIGDLIVSGNNGLAQYVKPDFLIQSLGKIVGKIIEIDEVKCRFKVLLMLK